MLSPMDSTLSRLSTISQTLASNASLPEKIIKMEELTSMLSSITAPSFADQELVSSMLRDTIRISSLAESHHKRCTTMRRKMVTLWLGGCSDQVEGDFLRLAIAGLNSCWLRIEMSFLSLLNNFALEISFALSLPSELMPIGDLLPSRPTTSIQLGWSLTRHTFLNLIIGYENILKDAYLV